MAQRKKFNLGGSRLEMRETEPARQEESTKSQAQRLVTAIENAEVNTAFNFKMIPRSKLVFHKDNQYPMEAVEKLAASILDVGLIHNIDVRYDEDNDTYIIDAGEQRTRALDMLIEKYRNQEDQESEEYQKYLYHVKPFEKGYPCKVSSGTSKMKSSMGLAGEAASELDEIEARLRLRISNEIGRGHDAVRTKKCLDEILELENRRNEILGKTDQVTNRELGEKLNISGRMVQKYKALDRLIPELREVFENQGITVTEGANYANLSPDEQIQLVELIRMGGNRKELAALYDRLNETQNAVKEKERELEELRLEKMSAKEQAEAAKADAENLKQKLQEELRQEYDAENEEKRREIEQLKNRLFQANRDAEIYEKQKEELAVRSREIEELKEKLSRSRPAVSGEEAAAMRAALHLESAVRGVENALAEAAQAMQEYEKQYDPGKGMKAPEDYTGQIRLLIGRI